MNHSEFEDWLWAGLEEDYVSLDSITRLFTKDMFAPTQAEFENMLSFLFEFLSNNSVSVLYGEEMKRIDFNSSEQIISWLKNMWSKKNYEEFNYSVWLSDDIIE